ncbi:hypothetical protein HOD96_01125 [Candidatus Falkowbacteria bacterium]|jgi:hypothetical protein|nr:hypothetical protein [Candidatus Falkowbacteria bacterium]MBT4432921.1 hypothetical protein [Candidatus Falkowbacteria bacterium]
MSKKTILIYFLFFIVFSVFFTLPSLVQAEPWTPGKNLIPDDCRGNAEDCGVEDLVQVAINVFQLILGVLGSLTLLFFVYGGFVWVLSRGNQQMIQKGKDILTGALVGMSLVMASWVIVNFVIAALTGVSNDFSTIYLFDTSSWWSLDDS